MPAAGDEVPVAHRVARARVIHRAEGLLLRLNGYPPRPVMEGFPQST